MLNLSLPTMFTSDTSPSPRPDPASHAEALAARGNLRSFRRGTILIQEGDRGDTLYMVRSGRLRAYAAHPNGKEITLGIYGAGEYVGEMSLDGGPRSANVETLEATTCAVISRATLLAYIAEHPDFALEMMGRLIRRARLATESASSLALIDVYGRMTRLLDQLAGPPAADGTRTVEERLTHRELASHLACSREMVTRLMGDLETGGYIAVREKRIVLLKGLPARW
jgi:CRP/FNR family cyclic AMP-dependent transcriptional regulator